MHNHFKMQFFKIHAFDFAGDEIDEVVALISITPGET